MREDPAIVQVLKTEEQLKQFSQQPTRDENNNTNEKKFLENLYQTVFENSAVAITLTDEHEHIISWNRYAEYLLGMTKDDFYLKPVSSLYPPEEWQKIRAQNVRQKGIQHHLETRMLRKNNDLIDVEVSLSVVKDYYGKIIGSIGIIKDISTQKKMKLAFEQSEQRFKQLYERAPVPYHTLSPDGVITDVKEKWGEVFGFSKDEVIGRSIFDFVVGSEQETARSSFRTKQLSGQTYTGGHERRYNCKNGEERLFITHDFFSFDTHNKVIAVQTTMEDITERKKIEKELYDAQQILTTVNQDLERKVTERTVEVMKLLQQKDAFIHQLGHDLKTPLTPILNLLPTVIQKPDDPKNQERLMIIKRNAHYIYNLVTDILKLVKLNSSTVQLDFTPTLLTDFFATIVKDNQLLFEEKNISLHQNIPRDLTVEIDEVLLRDVITNLLSNSIKFMEIGGTITINAEKQNDNITFSISDTGIGLTEDQQLHVFEEFYKADSSRHEVGSSGLGLTICKRIIEWHGGRMWVESPGLGKGTTFYFTLSLHNIKKEKKE